MRSNKQPREPLSLIVKAQTPKQAGNLSQDCTEIIEEPKEEVPKTAEGKEQVEDAQDQEEEEIIDPDDPLYGLEQRLAELDIDEESKAVLKRKLLEAGHKIKQGLEDRQQSLDAKIAAIPQGRKK